MFGETAGPEVVQKRSGFLSTPPATVQALGGHPMDLHRRVVPTDQNRKTLVLGA